MNTIVKVGIASALAMGYASAHASITIPGSTGSQSDVMLFAEVVSGSTVLGSYAGDTGVATGTTLTSSNLKISNSSDSNLQSLLTLGASAGNTVEWAVLGGQFSIEGAVTPGDYYLTTLTSGASSLQFTKGGNYSDWSTTLTGALQTVQANAVSGANSVFASTVAKGGVWDGTLGLSPTGNLSNWNLNGADNAVVGLTAGTGATLYGVTSGGTTDVSTPVALGTLSLTASGLSYTPAGTGTSPVPLPAAVWLLGSGLLGLAGVGRRKASTV